MSSFLIIFGFILSFIGMIFGPHYLFTRIKNIHDARAIGFLCMLPGIFLFCIGFYFR